MQTAVLSPLGWGRADLPAAGERPDQGCVYTEQHPVLSLLHQRTGGPPLPLLQLSGTFKVPELIQIVLMLGRERQGSFKIES